MTGLPAGNELLTAGLAMIGFGGIVASLRNVPKLLWHALVRRCSISVEVPDRDVAFRWLQKWIAAHAYAQRSRTLSLATTWVEQERDPTTSGSVYCSATSGRLSEAKFLLSPAPGTHFFLYRRHLVVFHRVRRDLQDGGSYAYQETFTLRIVWGTRALVNELLREAHQAAMPEHRGVNILQQNKQGQWSSSMWQPLRPRASLVLPGNTFEDLLADVTDFLASPAWYARRGIPHRRGYLLHGPPGNGKTTTVAAVAGELGLSIAVLNLSDKLLTDDTLRDLVNALPVGTVLLLEDIDCAFRTRAGEEAASAAPRGVTLSGLLNAIDGVGSREGRILFMTTNHPERLDPALVRPGRADRSLFFGNTTPEQAEKLFLWFYAGDGPDVCVAEWARQFAAGVPANTVCMAAIQEHLLRYRNDPVAAVRMASSLYGDVPAPFISLELEYAR